MGIGSKGRIEVFEDFMGFSSTTMGDSQLPQGKVNYCGVGTGSFAQITDEPGGILQATTSATDNDNFALFIGPFKPADGGVVMETRLKLADITKGTHFIGFQETLDQTTPVVAATSDSNGTLTHGVVGSHAGFFFDAIKADTIDWFAIAGDGAVAASNSDANGTGVTEAPVNDQFDVLRVEINTHGDADFFFGGPTGLKHVKSIESAVTASDLQFAVVMVQTDSTAAAAVLETDYMLAEGSIDWTQ